MIVVEILIVSFFLIWGIATLFYQFRATEMYISIYNYFSLVPKWTFFAPIPKTTDYVLYYQDYDIDTDQVFDPVEIDLYGNETRFAITKLIWNPEKRPLKALTDMTSLLLKYKKKHRRKIDKNSLVLELYTPYIVLVNFVNNYAQPSSQNCKRRFLIYSTYGYFSTDDPTKTFESYFHEFD
ncbi:hypothetical protein [Aquimarina mytili]|uniref:Uncharacterized protein n=1 Tax=Aquimarina mytili TaxID=874423 RepID=A0A936ZRE5_9FLAO|nr:hypothetical protein [Aquimarina mytili]MBL0683328.1 hypothetical protein [Aquimarina mytili]